MTSHQSKIDLKTAIESLVNVEGKTIGEVIDSAHSKGVCIIGDKLERYKTGKSYLYNRICELPYKEFQEAYDYREGISPFTTQHKTKGAEFDNVLVVLDNGGWNSYNFEKFFRGTASESVESRTRKIFYVCCTRAKENLAVFYHDPPPEVIAKAKEWFGEENVINLGVI